jgi:hypothetical protein
MRATSSDPGASGGKSDRHAVVMRSDVKRVLVGQRNIDLATKCGEFREGGDPGLRAANCVTQRCGESRGQHRVGVFQFTAEADDATFAVTLRLVGAHDVNRELRQHAADLRTCLDAL